MQLRTARSGPNAGSQFWGCSTYPVCREIINVEDVEDGEGFAQHPQTPVPRVVRSVSWDDGTLVRPGLVCTYANAGGSLRALAHRDLPWHLVAQSWMARPDTGHLPSPDVARIVGLMRKIVQRGTAPPLDPSSERALLERLGLGSETRQSELPGDLSLKLERAVRADDFEAAACWNAADYKREHHLDFDSDEELDFHDTWIASSLGATATRWFMPQASLDRLAYAGGLDTHGSRRVDFLVSAPWIEPFVVEIDGGQHVDSVETDGLRDQTLAELGLDVVRVTTNELASGKGAALAEIVDRWRDPAAPPELARDLLWAPALTHRAVLSLLEGVSGGILAGDRWIVEVDEPTGFLDVTLPPYLRLLSAIDRLWGGSVFPNAVELRFGARVVVVSRDGEVKDEPPANDTKADLVVRLEPDRTSVDAVDAPGPIPAITSRSASIPVRLRCGFFEGSRKAEERSVGEQTDRSLRTLLQSVFAKEDFLEGQLDAVFELIEGRDCAVLLPTGGGKSLIYQLAGLCLPGRTLVVDPLVALMEDQVEGLNALGVDRVALLSGYQTQLGLGSALMAEIEAGEALFIFVAPERLQQQAFRSALGALSQTTPINLSVVDEAHCVSEWGHDFRPSYLHLGRTLRQVCTDPSGSPAPLLALTGTASRAVLRDVLIELGIERDSDRAVIRPRTFDRPELHFQIVRTEPAGSEAALAGAVRGIPHRFNLPEADLFRSKGAKTSSGLVFCPHASGKHGIEAIANHLSAVIGHRPATYAGGAPKGYDKQTWEELKRRHAAAFKANEASVLVSTKAFGMGIDKPNIRYVVHYGIPGSIEGYYQEVGRAGRDRRHAECVLVLIEYDEDRARKMVSEDADLEETRGAADVKIKESDDITRQLFFHLNSFRGKEDELADIQDLIDEIDDLGSRQTLEIPMGDTDDRVARERGIYRLAVLGVVRDYVVEWGSRAFVVEMARFSSADVKQGLVGYVARSSPGRVAVVREQLDGLDDKVRRHDAVLECAEVLIDFVYDTIERSRRRSLREMWLAARESDHDADQAFRARILDYLSQGDVAPRLEALADSEELQFGEWQAVLDSVEPGLDARELRGNAGRLLTSFPDHPGLLLARGVSEVLDDRGELKEFGSNLRSALQSARSRYGVDDDQLEDLAGWLRELSSIRRGALAFAVEALSETGSGAATVERILDQALLEPGFDEDVRAISLSRGLQRMVASVDAVLEPYEGRLN